jgi:hypothetical protein
MPERPRLLRTFRMKFDQGRKRRQVIVLDGEAFDHSLTRMRRSRWRLP